MTSILQITFRMWGLIASLIFIFTASSVHAAPFICDATQASANSLPVLSESCPIGKGLWGKQLPPKNSTSFWIQCGVFRNPLSLAEAKIIYDVITTDVWMKPENNAYRCLIGPYEDYSLVKSELKKVHNIARYKQAFIRAFGRHESEQSVSVTPVKKPQQQSLPQQPPQIITRKPSVPAVDSGVKTPATKQTLPPGLTNKVSIRKQLTLDGIEYVIPFIESDSVQFYMEYDKPWNRMSYVDANKTCTAIDMQLATVPQWKKLLNSDLMKKDQWPIYLPYWGKDSIGLFTSGKTSQLKGTSLLNVLCVQL